jgi:inward rectifier potassium channel
MRPKPITVKEPGADYEIQIVGDRRTPLRDFYHALLRLPWWVTIAAISGSFLAANALFAVAYLLVGGVAHAAPWSFGDAFFFSV